MSASTTAVLAVPSRSSRADGRMIEIAVPPHRASLDPVAGALRSSTVLVVAPGHAAWAPLTAGMLETGIGRVLRAESPAAVDAIIAQQAAGDLALVSTALGRKSRKVIHRLRAAGWRRVLALATGADPAPVIAALLAGAGGALGAPADPDSSRKDFHLTRRQVTVLQHVAHGMPVKRIAHELGISPSVVKRHLRQIAAELGTDDPAGMVGAGLRAGLIC